MDKKSKSPEFDVEQALIKKALGYETEEIIEEFACDEKTEKSILVKKKKTTKQIPPDLSAIKILLSYYGNKTFDELNSLSDEELLQERDALLQELKSMEEN